MLVITSAGNNKYRVAFYGRRACKVFDCWLSNLMSYGQAIALRLRIERHHKRQIGRA